MEQEQEVRLWIEAVLGDKLKSADFYEALKDGQVLCRLLNQVVPGACPKINGGKMPFMQMENISQFLQQSQALLNIPKHESFQTVDLFELKNKNAVLLMLQSFARHASKYAAEHGKKSLPQLGPKIADKHQVDFTQEQLQAGQFAPTM